MSSSYLEHYQQIQSTVGSGRPFYNYGIRFSSGTSNMDVKVTFKNLKKYPYTPYGYKGSTTSG